MGRKRVGKEALGRTLEDVDESLIAKVRFCAELF